MTNLELLQELWRTWKEGGGAALVRRYDEFFTEDAEWRPPTRELTGARYVGRDGLAQYVRDIARLITELRGELEDLTEIAPDVIRCTVRMHAHGKVSGVTIDAPMIAIGRFRAGRIALAWASYDPEAAERAAEAIVHGERVPA